MTVYTGVVRSAEVIVGNNMLTRIQARINETSPDILRTNPDINPDSAHNPMITQVRIKTIGIPFKLFISSHQLFCTDTVHSGVGQKRVFPETRNLYKLRDLPVAVRIQSGDACRRKGHDMSAVIEQDLS